MITARQRQQILRLDEELSRIAGGQTLSFDAHPEERAERRARALIDYEFFCETYFPYYCTSKMAQFQREAAQQIADNRYGLFFNQWFRGAAKSTHFDLFIPLWLMIKGEVKYAVIVV